VDWLTEPQAWIALASLTALEIVLGVDNIVFISILTSRLPAGQQSKARTLGLLMALFGRVALLLSLTWIMRLESTLFTAFSQDISGRDLILFSGGLFLLGKATHEIHAEMEGHHESGNDAKTSSFRSVLVQILLLDIVFSLDSVITAVGMVDRVALMITAIVIAMGFMIFSAGAVSGFIERHPTVKILALSFLLLVGVALLAEGFELHLPRAYIYFAMGFSVLVELLNLRASRRRKEKGSPVR
jgi:predicted tellurium resistance membrane protein TerC